MVKSGLDPSFLDDKSPTAKSPPRVSPYRLSAHLGAAFVLYLLSAGTAMRVLRVGEAAAIAHAWRVDHAPFRRVSRAAHVSATLALITAISGAVVAGLDAGLIYGTWPRMGDNFVPPLEELIVTPEGRENSILAMYFENPVTAQFVHRSLAYTTFTGITATYLCSRRMPIPIRTAIAFLAGAATLQGTLGVLTLIHMVPIPIAAAHQAGSLNLITAALYLMSVLKPFSRRL